MRNLRVRFTPEAAGLISKFHPENKKLIKAAIKELRRDPHLGDDLQEELSGFKSYKLKRYRILYRVNEDENFLEIYYVGHRSDVYEQFRLLLNKLPLCFYLTGASIPQCPNSQIPQPHSP